MLEDVCIYFGGTCLVSLMSRCSFYRRFKIDEEWPGNEGSTYIIYSEIRGHFADREGSFHGQRRGHFMPAKSENTALIQ